MTSAHKHQRKTHGRTLGTSCVGGGSRAPIPVADEAQGGVSPVRRSTSLTGRASGLGLFSHSRCARRVGIPNAAPRRLALSLLPERGAIKFSAALLIGRGHQLNRIGNQLGRYLAYPLHSLERLSSWAGFDDQQHASKGVGSAQEVIGVFQHDHC